MKSEGRKLLDKGQKFKSMHVYIHSRHPEKFDTIFIKIY